MNFGTALLLETAVGVVQVFLAFFGFWLAWRTLLPVLPGPPMADDRIAPFAHYFTRPLVEPISQALHVSASLASFGLLVVLAALIALLERVPDLA